MKYKIVAATLLFLDYSKSGLEPDCTQKSREELRLEERIREEQAKKPAAYGAHHPIDLNSCYIYIQLNKELEEAMRRRKKGTKH